MRVIANQVTGCQRVTVSHPVTDFLRGVTG